MTFGETEKEVTIKAPWGNIAGLTWGDSSNPPVLLCPGRMEVCSAFRPLVLRLPQNFFYVAIDLPGNGFSDHLPKGLQLTTFDLVPSVVRVQEHFGWTKFAFIGHSLGAAVGKYYNMAYPDRLTRIIDLDPLPAYHTILKQNIFAWYKEIYGNYYTDKMYKKLNSGKENAPTYTFQQLKELFIKVQDLTDEAVECNLERMIEPVGDGLYRLTYDQRMKNLFTLPFTSENLREMFTMTEVPTLAILSNVAVRYGSYMHVPFVTDVNAWPNRNYTFKIVPGNHNVHVIDPKCIAEDISKFLLEDFKSKL